MLLALFASLTIRKIYKIQRRKEELDWEQFVANDAFRGYTILNHMASEDDGVRDSIKIF